MFKLGVKRVSCATFAVLVSPLIIAQTELLPPHSVSIDPKTLAVTWKSPGYVVLQEDFEEESFPPEGWQISSAGKGWKDSEDLILHYWKIPSKPGLFAISNDDSAATGNNGSLDYLISPTLDLTEHDSLVLSFDSYFDGAYGQSAMVEYSIDGGNTWMILYEMAASLVWERNEIDLSAMSGATGLQSVKFAFHACDNGYNGSGWAVDNIEISNSLAEYLPENYILIYDTAAVDTTSNLMAFIPTTVYTYNEEHSAGICACYPEGHSDTVTIPFISEYLFPVWDLTTESCGKHCIGLSWYGPYIPPECLPWELQGVFQTPEYWQEGGCATDGAFIYLTYKNMNRIAKLDLEGNLVGMYNVPGVPPLTNLTFCIYDNYFYGCNGTHTIYVINLYDNILVRQFQAPVEVYSITHDEDWGDAFWGNDLSSDFTLFFEDGTVIATISPGNFGNFHGLAYDPYSPGGPYLWGFSRDSSGCLLVQYEVATGTPTGFTKDLSNLVSGGGLAGGLYYTYGLYQQYCMTLGGNIENEIIFNYSLGEEHPPGWTPEGLWGYYLYRDQELFDSIEIHCARFPFYFWYPEDTLPQSHNFSVSVKYELDMFGMEDQIDFSEPAGPVKGSISYGNGLDLEEDWIPPSFYHNRWYRTGTRWEMSNSLGNPVPAAVFRGNPGTGPYSDTLMSTLLLPDSSAFCSIFLYYDLKLMDFTPTGNQTMVVEFWDSGTRDWLILNEYHNDTVWDVYVNEFFDVTDKIKNRYCRLRFIVYGDDSSDIQFWIIDNIRIERSCPPPDDLVAEYDTETESIFLEWATPFSEMNQWIYWGDTTQYSTVGIGFGPATWCDVAARWERPLLESFNGADIKQVAFIPSDPETHYIVKIWTGDSARYLKAEIAVSDLVIDQWNVIELDEPLILDGSEELWIGYSFSTKGQDPISLDAGPAVDSSGNLFRIGEGEWTTLLNISPSFDGNVNVQGLLHKPEKHPNSYRLFKSVDSGTFQYLSEISGNEYTDTAITLNSMHCYKVQSNCFPLPDSLYSPLSEETCVLPVIVNEGMDFIPGLKIYPNPTYKDLHILSPEIIERIEIYDDTGKMVMELIVNDFQTDVSLDSFIPAIFTLVTRTFSTSYCNKIVVLK